MTREKKSKDHAYHKYDPNALKFVIYKSKIQHKRAKRLHKTGLLHDADSWLVTQIGGR